MTTVIKRLMRPKNLRQESKNQKLVKSRRAKRSKIISIISENNNSLISMKKSKKLPLYKFFLALISIRTLRLSIKVIFSLRQISSTQLCIHMISTMLHNQLMKSLKQKLHSKCVLFIKGNQTGWLIYNILILNKKDYHLKDLAYLLMESWTRGHLLISMVMVEKA